MDLKTLRNRIAEKARAVQTIVSEMESVDEALAYAVDLTQAQKQKTVAAPGLNVAAREKLQALCSASGVTLLDEPLLPGKPAIQTSLTIAAWGIADTGTIAIPSDSEDVRVATMLCETHVAVLPESTIAPDSLAIQDRLDQILKQDAPSYTAFITGASRTADIERVLAIGVHGPQELHLLIVKGA